MIDHIVEDAIKRVAKGFVEKETLSFMCPGVFEKVCEKNGWQFKLDNYGYNGWEADWWADVIIKEITVCVCGSMYYGYANIEINK